MNRARDVLALVLTLLLAGGCAHVDPTEAEDRAAIEAMRAADVAAVWAQDVDTLVGFWSEDAVVLPADGLPLFGRDAIRAMIAGGFEQLGDAELVEYTQDWQDLTVSGDVAHEWGRYLTRHRLPDDVELYTTSGSLLRVLHRERDGWRVVRSIWTVDPP